MSVESCAKAYLVVVFVVLRIGSCVRGNQRVLVAKDGSNDDEEWKIRGLRRIGSFLYELQSRGV
jgi:hypothetical protein